MYHVKVGSRESCNQDTESRHEKGSFAESEGDDRVTQLQSVIAKVRAKVREQKGDLIINVRLDRDHKVFNTATARVAAPPSVRIDSSSEHIARRPNRLKKKGSS